eukprot:gb/GECG01010583.1/.p1 GENE.gb/GECG01010583.1/~~gb/GECG01010583.1/.p1  ORF type:complete len:378 (+),score=52.81 gb/GECG01010583.1/:1-1134(+)
MQANQGQEQQHTAYKDPESSPDSSAPGSREQCTPAKKGTVKTDPLLHAIATLPDGIPKSSPHPHFPCLIVIDSNLNGLMESVREGIEDSVDQMHIPADAGDKYHLEASVFIGGERIRLSVHLFMEVADKQGSLAKLFLQGFCHSGYGWNFYTVWNGILDELRCNSKKVQRYFPAKEADHQPILRKDKVAPTQLPRSDEASAFFPSSSQGSELAPLPDIDMHAPAAVPGEPTDEDFINLMESKFESERCLGMEFVGSDLKKFGTPAVIRCLFKCVGSESSYSGSRIRAMSLLNRMVKSGLCSASLIDFDSLKSGLTALVRECRDESNCSPSFLYMVDEYVSFAEKFIETVAKRLHVEADSSIRDKTAKLKQFCHGNRT